MILIGTTNLRIDWTGIAPSLLYVKAGTMIQYRIPIRNNTPQYLQYTFRDELGNVIDLSTYAGIVAELKLQGQVFAAIAANYILPRNTGMVFLNQVFAQVGIWNVQFQAVNGQNQKVYGEPIQFTVVPNVDDLGATDLPVY